MNIEHEIEKRAREIIKVKRINCFLNKDIRLNQSMV